MTKVIIGIDLCDTSRKPKIWEYDEEKIYIYSDSIKDNTYAVVDGEPLKVIKVIGSGTVIDDSTIKSAAYKLFDLES